MERQTKRPVTANRLLKTANLPEIALRLFICHAAGFYLLVFYFAQIGATFFDT